MDDMEERIAALEAMNVTQQEQVARLSEALCELTDIMQAMTKIAEKGDKGDDALVRAVQIVEDMLSRKSLVMPADSKIH